MLGNQEEDEGRSSRLYSINDDNFEWNMENKENTDFSEDIKYFRMIRSKIINMINRGLKNLIEEKLTYVKAVQNLRQQISMEGVLWKPYFNKEAIDTICFL